MDSTLIAEIIGAAATIAAAIIAAIVAFLLRARNQEGVKAKGSLRIFEVVFSPNEEEDDRNLLDFRVHNEGGSEVLEPVW